MREWLAAADPASLDLRRREAEILFMRIGVTFAVYGEGGDPERIIPFDIIPRVINGREWDLIALAGTARQALNHFWSTSTRNAKSCAPA